MPNIRFNQIVKEGRVILAPGPVYGFEDPNAVPYFVRMQWGTETDDAADVTFDKGSLTVDVTATFADGPMKGQTILTEVIDG